MFDFTGRTAIVTGGSSGIGLLTVQELARQGANVTLVDKNMSFGSIFSPDQ